MGVLKHGHTARKNGKTPRLYNIWCKMRYRCTKTNNPDYTNYGARGIKVCREWNDYSNFYQWAMLNGYNKTLTIDRINNNGNYEPSNCRWITLQQQNRNYRKNIYFTYQENTLCLKDWTKQLGLNYQTVYMRIKRGTKIKNALEL